MWDAAALRGVSHCLQGRVRSRTPHLPLSLAAITHWAHRAPWARSSAPPPPLMLADVGRMAPWSAQSRPRRAALKAGVRRAAAPCENGSPHRQCLGPTFIGSAALRSPRVWAALSTSASCKSGRMRLHTTAQRRSRLSSLRRTGSTAPHGGQRYPTTTAPTVSLSTRALSPPCATLAWAARNSSVR